MVRSVGTARPRLAIAVAHGLGLPIDATLRAIYQAPSKLVDGLQPEAAERLAGMLAKTGLETEVVPTDHEFDKRGLLDVAVHIVEAETAHDVAGILADFCACDEARALDLLTAPPGIVLGSVSEATVRALREALAGTGAKVVASAPGGARYAALPATASRKAAAEIKRFVTAQAEAGNALDLSHEDATRLWDRFGRTGQVRIVNRDFLRFELWLDAAADSGTELAALERLSGIPAEYHAQVLAAAPVILEHGLDHDTLTDRLAAYAAAGLKVRGEMTTFVHAAVRVPRAATGELTALIARKYAGEAPLSFPWTSPPMFETRARLLAAELRRDGCETEIIEAGYG